MDAVPAPDPIAAYYARCDERRSAAWDALQKARADLRDATPETVEAARKALRVAERAYDRAAYVGD